MSDRGTVLVVEDEAAVRKLAAKILRRQGYTVVEAGDAHEAVEIAASGQAINGLLTDVVLPGMKGDELARTLRKMHPELRVIYMSGYEEDELSRQGVGGVGAAYITKPFTADVLTLMVDGVMA